MASIRAAASAATLFNELPFKGERKIYQRVKSPRDDITSYAFMKKLCNKYMRSERYQMSEKSTLLEEFCISLCNIGFFLDEEECEYYKEEYEYYYADRYEYDEDIERAIEYEYRTFYSSGKKYFIPYDGYMYELYAKYMYSYKRSISLCDCKLLFELNTIPTRAELFGERLSYDESLRDLVLKNELTNNFDGTKFCESVVLFGTKFFMVTLEKKSTGYSGDMKKFYSEKYSFEYIPRNKVFTQSFARSMLYYTQNNTNLTIKNANKFANDFTKTFNDCFPEYKIDF